MPVQHTLPPAAYRDPTSKLNRSLRHCCTGAAALLALILNSPASGAVWQVDAAKLFDQSVTENLRFTPDRTAIELETGELFEDDGPAAGHSYQRPKNEETLSSTTWIKKELLIPNPQARAAFLVLLSGDSFDANINGRPVQLGANQSRRQLYRTYAFDPGLLRTGRNEIVLKGSGRVLIARDDEFALGSRTRTRHPNRSAKSTDSGKSWDYDHLGPEGQIDGEYGVRVFLDHFRPTGSLTLPVLDTANLEGNPIAAPLRQLGPVQVRIDGDPGPGGRFTVRARTGPGYGATDPGWSDWRPLSPTGGMIEAPQGRFLQVAIEFGTDDPLRSPQLKSVQVSASLSRSEDWTARVKVQQEHNEQIVRTSIPFEYEPLTEPRLARLRAEYHLDQVVEGAGTELEAPALSHPNGRGRARCRFRVWSVLGSVRTRLKQPNRTNHSPRPFGWERAGVRVFLIHGGIMMHPH